MYNLLNIFKKGNSVAENPQTVSKVLNPNTPIHNDLTMFYLMLVEELKKYSSGDNGALQQKDNEISKDSNQVVNIIEDFDKDIEREKSNLAILGFNNAKSERLKQYEEEQMKFVYRLQTLNKERQRIREKINYLRNQQITKEILLRLKKDFGEEALFVRYDDFEKVINKYNLVCGRLSDYKGVLPEHKMADINRVLTMEIPEFWEDKISYIASYYIVSAYYSSKDNIKINYRFPFFTEDSFYEKIYPIAFVTSNTWRYMDKVKFFIAAPAHEMLTKEELQKEAELKRNARTKDPFICAHTKWGIIIFTKWGEEAEDEIIKKYET